MIATYPITEADEIDEALNVLELSIRLETGFREGFIKNDCFIRKMEINKDTHSIFNNEYHKNKTPIYKMRFKNIVFTTIGMLACSLDKALDKKFGDKNPYDRSQIGSLRSIIYMIRNACAHDPCNPTWICKDKYKLEPYTITIDTRISERIIFGKNVPQKMEFHLDFRSLDGTRLNFEHFHALDGLFLLAEYAKKIMLTESDSNGICEPTQSFSQEYN